ncbi:MAG: hypothetical protein AVDCRST_MAG93-4452, partial [uncultured Chloroflexia bacterium]
MRRCRVNDLLGRALSGLHVVLLLEGPEHADLASFSGSPPFGGAGSIDGRSVRCLTAEVQMLCHTGYV